MKKLRLDIDELEVEAFPTTELESDQEGTVFAHSLDINCGYTPDGQCIVSGKGGNACGMTFSDCNWYCDPTYTCNTATECITA